MDVHDLHVWLPAQSYGLLMMAGLRFYHCECRSAPTNSVLLLSMSEPPAQMAVSFAYLPLMVHWPSLHQSRKGGPGGGPSGGKAMGLGQLWRGSGWGEEGQSKSGRWWISVALAHARSYPHFPSLTHPLYLLRLMPAEGTPLVTRQPRGKKNDVTHSISCWVSDSLPHTYTTGAAACYGLVGVRLGNKSIITPYLDIWNNNYCEIQAFLSKAYFL